MLVEIWTGGVGGVDGWDGGSLEGEEEGADGWTDAVGTGGCIDREKR